MTCAIRIQRPAKCPALSAHSANSDANIFGACCGVHGCNCVLIALRSVQFAASIKHHLCCSGCRMRRECAPQSAARPSALDMLGGSGSTANGGPTSDGGGSFDDLFGAPAPATPAQVCYAKPSNAVSPHRRVLTELKASPAIVRPRYLAAFMRR